MYQGTSFKLAEKCINKLCVRARPWSCQFSLLNSPPAFRPGRAQHAFNAFSAIYLLVPSSPVLRGCVRHAKKHWALSPGCCFPVLARRAALLKCLGLCFSITHLPNYHLPNFFGPEFYLRSCLYKNIIEGSYQIGCPPRGPKLSWLPVR